MRRLNRSIDSVSAIPKTINQKLVNSYRTKLFLKIKDSFERNKKSLKNDDLLFITVFKPINNFWFTSFIRA